MMNKVLHLPGKVSFRLLRHGLIDTLRWGWSHVSYRYREWQLKIETDAWIEAHDLGFNEECHGYEPISFASFDSVTDYLDIEPDKEVFLDYGCGKGRAIVLAAVHPFRKVIGVELSESLCEVARDNIKKSRPKLKCRNVEIVCCDATQYDIPDDVSVIFIWNSFTGSILQKVHQNIQNSIVDNPRKLTILNGVPHGERNMMDGLDWLPEGFLLPSKFFTGVDIFAYELRT
ncbi:MAG: class I SAM-dependent methyltransferase [Pseudomonadota bacterium]